MPILRGQATIPKDETRTDEVEEVVKQGTVQNCRSASGQQAGFPRLI